MARAAAWPRIRTPAALACSSSSSWRGYLVGSTPASENDSGRPDASAIERKRPNSASTSSKSDTTWSTPGAGGADGSGDPEQLVGVGGEGGRELAVGAAVVAGAGGAEADGAGLDGLPGEPRPCASMSSGVAISRWAPRSPITLSRERAVRHVGGEVDVVGAAVERVEELGERLPGPRQALVQRRTGDVLHALHELDEPVVVGGAHGREADPAVAGHHGGDAVPRRRDEPVSHVAWPS